MKAGKATTLATKLAAADKTQIPASGRAVIVLTGGGTGGHITPILAVAHELKRQLPNCQTIYVGERGSKLRSLTDNHAAIDASYRIFSGKYRRFYGESWLKRLFDVKTNLFNLRDVFLVAIGLVQAWWLLGRLKPSVVFLKGGFVGVPVGIAAAMRGIPLVTHDSDALPGLANRLVSRWVSLHATAMPAETYAYPIERTKQVGVLVEHTYKPVDAQMQLSYRKQLSLPESSKVLLVTGGSSGAVALNEAVKSFVIRLLNDHPSLWVIHQAGKGKTAVFDGIQHERLRVVEFMSPMYVYMGAATVVVTRASGNTLAELGVQGKSTIAVPSPYLADGHQLRNADYLQQQGAAVVVTEDTLPQGLEEAIDRLLADEKERHELARKLQQLSPSDAAQKLATLIIQQLG